MLTGFKLYAVLAVVAIAIALGGAAGGKLGFDAGYKSAEGKASAVIIAKNKEISDLKRDRVAVDANLGTCLAANKRYDDGVATQLQMIADQLRTDAQAKDKAAAENAKVSRSVMDAAAKSANNSAEAREAILHAAEKCLRDGVPADYVGMLNNIIRPIQTAGTQASSDALPAAPSGH